MSIEGCNDMLLLLLSCQSVKNMVSVVSCFLEIHVAPPNKQNPHAGNNRLGLARTSAAAQE